MSKKPATHFQFSLKALAHGAAQLAALSYLLRLAVPDSIIQNLIEGNIDRCMHFWWVVVWPDLGAVLLLMAVISFALILLRPAVLAAIFLFAWRKWWWVTWATIGVGYVLTYVFILR